LALNPSNLRGALPEAASQLNQFVVRKDVHLASNRLSRMSRFSAARQ